MATKKSTESVKDTAEAAKDRFLDSVKSSLDDAEELLREAATASGEQAVELRERALASLRRTRDTLHDVQDEVVERGRRAARVTDDYVHDNPWQSIGIAGLAGLLVGVLIARR